MSQPKMNQKNPKITVRELQTEQLTGSERTTTVAPPSKEAQQIVARVLANALAKKN